MKHWEEITQDNNFYFNFFICQNKRLLAYKGHNNTAYMLYDYYGHKIILVETKDSTRIYFRRGR